MSTKPIRGSAVAALLMAMTIAGAVLARPAKAQDTAGNLVFGVTAPVAVALGDSVRLAVFNGGRRPTRVRFALVDAVNGDRVAGSESGMLTVAPRKGVVFDVLIDERNFPTNGEIIGVFSDIAAGFVDLRSSTQKWTDHNPSDPGITLLRASLQVRNKAGETMTFDTTPEDGTARNY